MSEEKKLNKLYKEDGTKVEVNDNSLSYALSIGWTKENPVKKVVAKEKPVKK